MDGGRKSAGERETPHDYIVNLKARYANPHGHSVNCYSRQTLDQFPSLGRPVPFPFLLFPPLLPRGYPPHFSSLLSPLFLVHLWSIFFLAKLHDIRIRLSAGLCLNRYTTSPSSPLEQVVGGYPPATTFPPLPLSSCCSTPPTLPPSPSQMAPRNPLPPQVPLGSSLMPLQSQSSVLIVSLFP